MRSFDRLSHSDIFMDPLAKKVHRQPEQAQEPAELRNCTTERKSGNEVEKKDSEKHRSATIRDRIVINGIR